MSKKQSPPTSIRRKGSAFPAGRTVAGKPVPLPIPKKVKKPLAMPINSDKPHLWKADVAASVDLYNAWFMQFAPQAFRAERIKTIESVKDMFAKTASLTKLSAEVLKAHPGILPSLRMSTCPPLARDRLIGLSGVSPNLVKKLEEGELPKRIGPTELSGGLALICQKIAALLDHDLLPWVASKSKPDAMEIYRSATVIADRLCGAQADPIIRNAQEQRQLAMIDTWLTKRGYKKTNPHQADLHPKTMPPATFAFRMNVRVNPSLDLNIPIDVIVQPKVLRADKLPIMIEAKSAGDFTNTNKRRKEESDKMNRLKERFGLTVPYVLFLCGYFDAGYLGYEAAEGIDWVWEHRIDDLLALGL